VPIAPALLAEATASDYVVGGTIGSLVVAIPAVGAWIISLMRARQEARKETAGLAMEGQRVAADLARQARADALGEWQNYAGQLREEIERTRHDSEERDRQRVLEIGELRRTGSDCQEHYGQARERIARQESEIQWLQKEFRRVLAKTGDAPPGTVLPVVITATADDGVIRDVGPQVGAMFNWTRKELIGQSVEVLMPEEFRPVHRDGLRAIAEGVREADPGKTIHGAALRRNGERFPVVVNLTSWTSPQTGRVFVNAEIRTDEAALAFPGGKPGPVEPHGPDAAKVEDPP
jgi:PAS domain S-box-containing protein